MKHGGKRKGAGRKPGPARIEKEALREFVRAKVAEHLGELIDAQLANAKGIKYARIRNKKTGKFEALTEEQFRALAKDAKEDLERIELYEKDPSVQAFTDLLNRTIDKPAEQEQKVDLTIHGTLDDRVKGARRRDG